MEKYQITWEKGLFCFIWVVLFQYLLYAICGNHTFIIFISTLLLSYFMTFVCCEISIRIPFLCLVTGTKYSPDKWLGRTQTFRLSERQILNTKSCSIVFMRYWRKWGNWLWIAISSWSMKLSSSSQLVYFWIGFEKRSTSELAV